MELFQMTCLKERKNLVIEKNSRITINFYKKLCLPVIAWNGDHLLKQVVPSTYRLKKTVFNSFYF